MNVEHLRSVLDSVAADNRKQRIVGLILQLSDAYTQTFQNPSPETASAYGCFRHQLLLPRPYLGLTKPLRLDIQCQRGASVKIGWKYLDD